MRRLGKVVAVMLAVLWLPLTTHCALEAAGMFSPHVDDHGAGCDHDTTHDECRTCSVVEGGDYRTSAGAIKVAAPDMVAGDDLLPSGLLELLQVPCPVAEYKTPHETDGWVADWNFTRRVAGMPRAPALNA
jgi:hypothetical protein